jgi:DNA repair protein RadC
MPEETSEHPVYNATIRELPSEERPRERLALYGPQTLSNAQLLAIVLRTGTRDENAVALGQRLIDRFGGLRGVARATSAELSKVKGVGTVKAIQIAACAELGKRIATRIVEDLHAINGPDDVADLLMPELQFERREHIVVLLLDVRNRVIKKVTVSIGSLDNAIAHPREIFHPAVANSAAGIILVHNHPSGDPTPSMEDRRLTARLVECGRLLGIDVLDHIILGHDRWVSLKQQNMM